MARFREKGFTLIEVVIGLSLFAVVLLLIVSFVFWLNYYNKRTQSDREVLSAAQGALDVMTYEVRGAQSIYTSTTTASQLSLQTTHYLPSNETYTYVDFFVCGTALCMKKETKDPFVLTPDTVKVTSFSITQLSNTSKPSIQISLTVTATNTSGDVASAASVTLTSTAALRSY